MPTFGAFTQPLAGAQESVVQPLLSSQFSATPATHAPLALQNSAPLHALASAHDWPGCGVCVHVLLESHASSVQGLLSSQPPGQLPPGASIIASLPPPGASI